MTDNILVLKKQVQNLTGTLKKQVEDALHLGCTITETDLGLVSSIKDTNYTVEFVCPSDAGLETGTVFILGNTYCDLTYAQKKLVAIDHMSKSRHKRHPCYQAFKIESYIGEVYRVKGKVIGTINFSSVPPRKEPFSKTQKEFVSFLGMWLGETLEKTNTDFLRT